VWRIVALALEDLDGADLTSEALLGPDARAAARCRAWGSGGRRSPVARGLPPARWRLVVSSPRREAGRLGERLATIDGKAGDLTGGNRLELLLRT
jgi:hypothetical protein